MSNESNNVKYLHRYIIRKIIEYFSQNVDSITSRYVLYFDSLENIILFDKEIKAMLASSDAIDDLKNKIGNLNLQVAVTEPYLFYNDEGGLEFEATQIEVNSGVNSCHIVFIPDCDQNKEILGDAFKNGIRNKFVDEQENKILFYLSVQNIASVSKTTEDFQKQGMPLSVENVFEGLKAQAIMIHVENQCKVVLYALKKIKANKPSGDNSLMEFAPIIRIVETQKLEQEDFHDLHMFQMNLSNLEKNAGNKLAENYRLYRDVSLALEDQELEDVMSSYDSKIISDIQKAYDKDERMWDLQISFEQILRYKKVNQKKFKIEQPILVLDVDNNELDHAYFLDFMKGNMAAFILSTKGYPKEKIFKIDIKFTQKAVAKSDEFVVEAKNSRGNYYRVIINNLEFCKNGSAVFKGGKENKTFVVLVSVTDTIPGFWADSCIGLTQKNNKFIYKLRAIDYCVFLGKNGEKTDIEIDVGSYSTPISINTAYRTNVIFEHPEGEVLRNRNFIINIDDNSAIIEVSVQFEESLLKTLKLFELFNRCFVYRDTFEIYEGKLENKHKKSEKYDTEEFEVGGKRYSVEALLSLEDKMVQNKYKYVRTSSLILFGQMPCNVPQEIEDAFDCVCEYFSHAGTIPSISTLSIELIELYKIYIGLVLEYIGKSSSHFEDKKPIGNDILSIFHLGTVVDNDGLVWLSPLNPLSVAYQIELSKKDNKWVELDEHLYESLGFGNMLPFMINTTGNILQATKGKYPIQWACYYDALQSVKGTANTFYKKIEDYYNKFNYLFKGISNATFKMNIIGIPHTSEIINAIFKLYKSNKIDENLFAIEINYYFTGTGKNDFDSMSDYNYVFEQASRFFGIKNIEIAEEFCDWYSEKVRYYAHFDSGEYEYSHIAFCAIQDSNQLLHLNAISTAKSGIMLEGLISDVPSSLDRNSGIYKYGFGLEYAEELTENSQLLQLACAFNELANCKSGSPATRNLSVAQGVQNTKSDKLDKIYKSSNWVVFVEPKIDLDFFIEQSDQDDDLIIIHYPDKNITSSGYTSITVTQKSEQYIEVIKEYLEPIISREIGKDEAKWIIKNFNAYSGEWLMNFINDNQVDEKISLVSAIQFCRKYFSRVYGNYIWVPIALDEVLRVTGSIGGTLTNVLFSKKVLISRGIIESQNSTSDDLLMAGIKIENKDVRVKYVPVEVKHGKCGADIRQKAHNQVCNTAYLLRKSFLSLEDSIPLDTEVIDHKIYRNYMIQHVISNIEKMLAYQIVERDDEYKKIVDSDIRVKLLNDVYTLDIDNDTDAYVLYFAEGQSLVTKSQNNQDKVIEISMPLFAMYEFLSDETRADINAETLSKSDMQQDQTVYDISIQDDEIITEDIEVPEGDKESEGLENEIISLKNKYVDEEKSLLKDETIEGGFSNTVPKVGGTNLIDIRVLIGNDTAKNPIYWEFGNKQLANRHLLITGSSGQGKTYSIQTMLYELTMAGVSSVIFDYTEGFMKNQLEKPFVDKLEGKIQEHIIYNVGVPVNPFIRHEIEIAGTIVREKPADVASRLADIFSHVYGFGDQQYSAIFTAALNGINTYGDNMTMRYFQSELESVQAGNKSAKTVISKMEPFFHTISFEGNDSFDWGNIIYGDEATINIFQLTLINREMQVIITELMLWDAWYYTKKYGSKEKPFVVVLDEAQNLSHKSSSPSAAILTEGRKFGWSAWFATQSLKVLKEKEVVRLSQAAFKLHFKPTDDEIVKIARQLDPAGENNWTQSVKNLKKGICIVSGDRVKANGVFGSTQPTIVSVESFENRLK